MNMVIFPQQRIIQIVSNKCLRCSAAVQEYPVSAKRRNDHSGGGSAVTDRIKTNGDVFSIKNIPDNGAQVITSGFASKHYRYTQFVHSDSGISHAAAQIHPRPAHVIELTLGKKACSILYFYLRKNRYDIQSQ